MEKKTIRNTLILWGALLLGMLWFAAKLAIFQVGLQTIMLVIVAMSANRFIREMIGVGG